MEAMAKLAAVGVTAVVLSAVLRKNTPELALLLALAAGLWMLALAAERLRGAGYAPYYLYRQKYMSGSFENVGWCRPGGTGWYNIYIMEELHTILSLGAGGSTKMVDPAKNHIERVFNLKFPQEYIQRPEKIAANQAAFRKFYGNM